MCLKIQNLYFIETVFTLVYIHIFKQNVNPTYIPIYMAISNSVLEIKSVY
jgi:hypothetical protein